MAEQAPRARLLAGASGPTCQRERVHERRLQAEALSAPLRQAGCVSLAGKAAAGK